MKKMGSRVRRENGNRRERWRGIKYPKKTIFFLSLPFTFFVMKRGDKESDKKGGTCSATYPVDRLRKSFFFCVLSFLFFFIFVSEWLSQIESGFGFLFRLYFDFFRFFFPFFVISFSFFFPFFYFFFFFPPFLLFLFLLFPSFCLFLFLINVSRGRGWRGA